MSSDKERLDSAATQEAIATAKKLRPGSNLPRPDDLGDSFDTFEKQTTSVDEAVEAFSSHDLSEVKAHIAKIEKEVEDLHLLVKEGASSIATHESKVSGDYSLVEEIKGKIVSYEERKEAGENLIAVRQRTLDAAKRDLALAVEARDALIEKLKVQNSCLNNANARLAEDTEALRVACSLWQERYDKLQDSQAAYDRLLRDLEMVRSGEMDRLAKMRSEAEAESNRLEQAMPPLGFQEDEGQDIPEIFPDEELSRKKGFFKRFILCLILAILAAFLLRAYVFETTYISGSSMEPTIHNGDRVITSKISYLIGDVERGDIVLIKAPDTSETVYYVKRVIALGGDTIEILNGEVAVNGEILSEPYLQGHVTNRDTNTVVPNSHVFVMGDNREVSRDSRSESLGTIPAENIIGKINFRFLPFEDFGKIE